MPWKKRETNTKKEIVEVGAVEEAVEDVEERENSAFSGKLNV